MKNRLLNTSDDFKAQDTWAKVVTQENFTGLDDGKRAFESGNTSGPQAINAIMTAFCLVAGWYELIPSQGLTSEHLFMKSDAYWQKNYDQNTGILTGSDGTRRYVYAPISIGGDTFYVRGAKV
jgi:hypothetical protein